MVARSDAIVLHCNSSNSCHVVLRGILSFIVYAVYDIFLWMTLPLYIARGRGGVQLLTHVVIMLYVMTLGDLARPAVLQQGMGGGDVECASELVRAPLVEEDLRRPLTDEAAEPLTGDNLSGAD